MARQKEENTIKKTKNDINEEEVGETIGVTTYVTIKGPRGRYVYHIIYYYSTKSYCHYSTKKNLKEGIKTPS